MTPSTAAKINPKDVEGTRRLRLMQGYMTAFEIERPVNVTGEHFRGDAQVWEIKYLKDKDEYQILSKEHQGKGLHYDKNYQLNTLLFCRDQPCNFKIQRSEESSEKYYISPAVRSDNCSGECVVGLSSFLVYPPMVGIMNKDMGDFRWSIENA